MSIAFLWPSMLPVVDQNAYFWAGPINDGTRLLSEIGTPAVAPFQTVGSVRPGTLMYMDIGADGVHRVSTAHRAGALVGVAVSPTDNEQRTIVKMYGFARVRTNDTDTFAHVPGYVACATANGHVFASADPANSNIAVGDIIGAGTGYYDVLLRIVSNAGFEQRVFGKVNGGQAKSLPASITGNEVYSAKTFRVAKATFTVSTSPAYAVNMAGSNNTGFAVSGGQYVATQIGNGVQLVLNAPLAEGCAVASHLHMAPTGGAMLRKLGCRVAGTVVTVYSPNWNTFMLNTGNVVQVSVTGNFEE